MEANLNNNSNVNQEVVQQEKEQEEKKLEINNNSEVKKKVYELKNKNEKLFEDLKEILLKQCKINQWKQMPYKNELENILTNITVMRDLYIKKTNEEMTVLLTENGDLDENTPIIIENKKLEELLSELDNIVKTYPKKEGENENITFFNVEMKKYLDKYDLDDSEINKDEFYMEIEKIYKKLNELMNFYLFTTDNFKNMDLKKNSFKIFNIAENKKEEIDPQGVNELENIKNIIKQELSENLKEINYTNPEDKKEISDYKKIIINNLDKIKLSEMRYSDFLEYDIELLLKKIKEKLSMINNNLKNYNDGVNFNIKQNMRELSDYCLDLVANYNLSLENMGEEEKLKNIEEKEPINSITNSAEEKKDLRNLTLTEGMKKNLEKHKKEKQRIFNMNKELEELILKNSENLKDEKITKEKKFLDSKFKDSILTDNKGLLGFMVRKNDYDKDVLKFDDGLIKEEKQIDLEYKKNREWLKKTGEAIKEDLKNYYYGDSYINGNKHRFFFKNNKKELWFENLNDLLKNIAELRFEGLKKCFSFRRHFNKKISDKMETLNLTSENLKEEAKQKLSNFYSHTNIGIYGLRLKKGLNEAAKNEVEFLRKLNEAMGYVNLLKEEEAIQHLQKSDYDKIFETDLKKLIEFYGDNIVKTYRALLYGEGFGEYKKIEDMGELESKLAHKYKLGKENLEDIYIGEPEFYDSDSDVMHGTDLGDEYYEF